MPSAASRFAEFAISLPFDEIPQPVVEAAKLHLLDTLGCGIAAEALGIATEGRAAMLELGGESRASVIGHRGGLPGANAAFANAVICHGLDFDDTHAGCVCHVSVVVCPAAIAAAETHGANGRELIAAIVAGNETVTRIGMATPGAFHKRGVHPTAVVGIFGAAAAGARLTGLDASKATNALGIAGSMGSGIFAYLADGSETKPIHAGWAAHGGLIACTLAGHGATGPSTVLEGAFGTYAVHADAHDVDLGPQLADLGSRWETPNIAYKPYPACHFTHAPVEALRLILASTPLSPDEIEEIVVIVPHHNYVQTVLEPAGDKVAPRTTYAAKFSLQYSAAAMLVHGSVGLDTYTEEAIADPRVLELAGRVTYEVRDYPTYPEALPGGVRVLTADGRTFEQDIPYQRGSPENPMSAEDVREKFRANASLALTDTLVDALETAVLSLEDHDNVRAVFAVVGEASAREAVAA